MLLYSKLQKNAIKTDVVHLVLGFQINMHKQVIVI